MSNDMTDEQKLELAREMFAAWDELNWDRVVALFAADGVLHSMMQEPVVGREAIAERMAVLASKTTRCELQIKTLGILDGRVVVERVDDFDFDGNHGVVPVVGFMRMAGGEVTEWLEYYDRPTLLAGLGMAADFAN